MNKLFAVLSLVVCMRAVSAGGALKQQQIFNTINEDADVSRNRPYLFLSGSQGEGRSALRGFEIIENDEDDDSVEENHNVAALGRQNIFAINNLHDKDEDYNTSSFLDDGEEVSETDILSQMQAQHFFRRNPQLVQQLKSKDHTGAIMIPDGIMEIEVQTVVDSKTGKTSLIVPKKTLEAIPDDSVVAFLEKPADDDDTSIEEQARANRVIVRRRRKGAKRNVRRRVTGNRRPSYNRRRSGNRVPARVIYPSSAVNNVRRRRPQNLNRNGLPILIQV